MTKYLLLAAGLLLGKLTAGFELMELHDVNDELTDFGHAHHDGYFQRGHGLEHQLDDEHTRPDADPDRGGGSDQYPVIYPYDDGPHRGDVAAGAMGLGPYAGYRGHGGFPAGREHMGEIYGGEGGNLPFDRVSYPSEGDEMVADYPLGGDYGYGHGFGHGYGHGFGDGGSYLAPIMAGGHHNGGFGEGDYGGMTGHGQMGIDGHGPDEHDHIHSDFSEGVEPNPDMLGPHPYGSQTGLAPNPLHQQAHEEAGDLGKHPHDWKHGHHHAHNPHGRFHHNGNGDLETHLHDDF